MMEIPRNECHAERDVSDELDTTVMASSKDAHRSKNYYKFAFTSDDIQNNNDITPSIPTAYPVDAKYVGGNSNIYLEDTSNVIDRNSSTITTISVSDSFGESRNTPFSNSESSVPKLMLASDLRNDVSNAVSNSDDSDDSSSLADDTISLYIDDDIQFIMGIDEYTPASASSEYNDNSYLQWAGNHDTFLTNFILHETTNCHHPVYHEDNPHLSSFYDMSDQYDVLEDDDSFEVSQDDQLMCTSGFGHDIGVPVLMTKHYVNNSNATAMNISACPNPPCITDTYNVVHSDDLPPNVSETRSIMSNDVTRGCHGQNYSQAKVHSATHALQISHSGKGINIDNWQSQNLYNFYDNRLYKTEDCVRSTFELVPELLSVSTPPAQSIVLGGDNIDRETSYTGSNSTHTLESMLNGNCHIALQTINPFISHVRANSISSNLAHNSVFYANACIFVSDRRSEIANLTNIKHGRKIGACKAQSGFTSRKTSVPRWRERNHISLSQTERTYLDRWLSSTYLHTKVLCLLGIPNNCLRKFAFRRKLDSEGKTNCTNILCLQNGSTTTVGRNGNGDNTCNLGLSMACEENGILVTCAQSSSQTSSTSSPVRPFRSRFMQTTHSDSTSSNLTTKLNFNDESEISPRPSSLRRPVREECIKSQTECINIENNDIDCEYEISLSDADTLSKPLDRITQILDSTTHSNNSSALTLDSFTASVEEPFRSTNCREFTTTHVLAKSSDSKYIDSLRICISNIINASADTNETCYTTDSSSYNCKVFINKPAHTYNELWIDIPENDYDINFNEPELRDPRLNYDQNVSFCDNIPTNQIHIDNYITKLKSNSNLYTINEGVEVSELERDYQTKTGRDEFLLNQATEVITMFNRARNRYGRFDHKNDYSGRGLSANKPVSMYTYNVNSSPNINTNSFDSRAVSNGRRTGLISYNPRSPRYSYNNYQTALYSTSLPKQERIGGGFRESLYYIGAKDIGSGVSDLVDHTPSEDESISGLADTSDSFSDVGVALYLHENSKQTVSTSSYISGHTPYLSCSHSAGVVFSNTGSPTTRLITTARGESIRGERRDRNAQDTIFLKTGCRLASCLNTTDNGGGNSNVQLNNVVQGDSGIVNYNFRSSDSSLSQSPRSGEYEQACYSDARTVVSEGLSIGQRVNTPEQQENITVNAMASDRHRFTSSSRYFGAPSTVRGSAGSGHIYSRGEPNANVNSNNNNTVSTAGSPVFTSRTALRVSSTAPGQGLSTVRARRSVSDSTIINQQTATDLQSSDRRSQSNSTGSSTSLSSRKTTQQSPLSSRDYTGIGSRSQAHHRSSSASSSSSSLSPRSTVTSNVSPRSTNSTTSTASYLTSRVTTTPSSGYLRTRCATSASLLHSGRPTTALGSSNNRISPTKIGSTQHSPKTTGKSRSSSTSPRSENTSTTADTPVSPVAASTRSPTSSSLLGIVSRTHSPRFPGTIQEQTSPQPSTPTTSPQRHSLATLSSTPPSSSKQLSSEKTTSSRVSPISASYASSGGKSVSEGEYANRSSALGILSRAERDALRAVKGTTVTSPSHSQSSQSPLNLPVVSQRSVIGSNVSSRIHNINSISDSNVARGGSDLRRTGDSSRREVVSTTKTTAEWPTISLEIPAVTTSSSMSLEQQVIQRPSSQSEANMTDNDSRSLEANNPIITEPDDDVDNGSFLSPADSTPENVVRRHVEKRSSSSSQVIESTTSDVGSQPGQQGTTATGADNSRRTSGGGITETRSISRHTTSSKRIQESVDSQGRREAVYERQLDERHRETNSHSSAGDGSGNITSSSVAREANQSQAETVVLEESGRGGGSETRRVVQTQRQVQQSFSEATSSTNPQQTVRNNDNDTSGDRTGSSVSEEDRGVMMALLAARLEEKEVPPLDSIAITALQQRSSPQENTQQTTTVHRIMMANSTEESRTETIGSDQNGGSDLQIVELVDDENEDAENEDPETKKLKQIAATQAKLLAQVREGGRGVRRAVPRKRTIIVDEELMEELFLRCIICSDRYDSEEHMPKLLPCHHTFCVTCLREMFRVEAEYRQTITSAFQDAPPSFVSIQCPTCRQTHMITDRTYKDMKSDYKVIELLEISKRPTKGTSGYCEMHRTQPLNHFCETCAEPVCSDCKVLDHSQRKGHVVLGQQEALNAYAGHIEKTFENVDLEDAELKTLEDRLNEAIRKIDDRLQGAVTNIRGTFAKFKSGIDERQNQLLEKIEDEMGKRETDLDTNLSDVSKRIETIAKTRETVTQAKDDEDVEQMFVSQQAAREMFKTPFQISDDVDNSVKASFFYDKRERANIMSTISDHGIMMFQG